MKWNQYIEMQVVILKRGLNFSWQLLAAQVKREIQLQGLQCLSDEHVKIKGQLCQHSGLREVLPLVGFIKSLLSSIQNL